MLRATLVAARQYRIHVMTLMLLLLRLMCRAQLHAVYATLRYYMPPLFRRWARRFRGMLTPIMSYAAPP